MEILKKQRNFALKLLLIMVALALFLLYSFLQDLKCTEEVTAIITTDSIKHYSGKYDDYISTKYTYTYDGITYEDSHVTYNKYEEGDLLTIYVNPDKPECNTVDPYELVKLGKAGVAWIPLTIILGFSLYIVIRRSLQIRKGNTT